MTNAMKILSRALLGFVACAVPLAAQEETSSVHTSTPDMKAALDQIVSQQINAFSAGNFAKAYSFAATGIQQLFPAADFEKMVRTAYPIMLAKPKIDFGVVLDDGQEGVAFVKLAGRDGTEEYRYTMVKEKTGWRIGGVQRVDAPVKNNRPPLSA